MVNQWYQSIFRLAIFLQW